MQDPPREAIVNGDPLPGAIKIELQGEAEQKAEVAVFALSLR
jgi:hypothetical protein